MFVGHYGPSFAAKAFGRRIPLWILFLAVQLLDVFWSIFVLMGIEKVRMHQQVQNPMRKYRHAHDPGGRPPILPAEPAIGTARTSRWLTIA